MSKPWVRAASGLPPLAGVGGPPDMYLLLGAGVQGVLGCISSAQPHVLRHLGSLTSAAADRFTPWKLAEATKEG